MVDSGRQRLNLISVGVNNRMRSFQIEKIQRVYILLGVELEEGG